MEAGAVQRVRTRSEAKKQSGAAATLTEKKQLAADQDDWWDNKDRCLREKRLRIKDDLQLADEVYNLFINDGYCVYEMSKISDYMYLGNASGARNAKLLVKHNIKYVLNVAQEAVIDEAFYTALGIRRLWLRTVDSPSFDMAPHFKEAIAFIGNAKKAVEKNKAAMTPPTNKKQGEDNNGREKQAQGGAKAGLNVDSKEEGLEGAVLVHCREGVSRSAAVVLAALMYLEGMSLKDAMLWVREKRSSAYPNKGFLRSLLRLEKDIFGNNSIPPAALDLHEDSAEV